MKQQRIRDEAPGMEITAMNLLTADDPETRSADLVADNVAQLKALFPEAVTEGGVDFDVLRQLLGDAVDDGEEKYGLNWHGKRRARRLALTPSTGTLRPCPEESVDWDTTQNLMIEGDNLEVLKLLQKSYSGKVKLIYIDPPYNTGKDLIYKNNFHELKSDYLTDTNQANRETGHFVSNPVAGGRYHSNWLSMMYPRLKLARRLLRKDGVLVCTIDENELTSLGEILKDVFEEGTYDHVCVTIVHNPRGVQGTNFSYTHEYAYFVFPRDMKVISDRRIDAQDITWSQFRNWGTESARHDARNCFYPVFVQGDQVVGFGDVCSDSEHPKQTEIIDGVAHVYPIDNSSVERKWRYARQSADSVQHLLRAKKRGDRYEIEIGKDSGLYRTVWTDKKFDANENGSRLLKALVPDAPFSFPKSLWAVYECVSAATQDDPESIVLDFFAGSGTTGHALLEMNKNDNGRRRYILVQIAEAVDGSTGFASIADVTKERLRRAGTKIREENPESQADSGFRVFKLDSSNIKAWEPDPDDLEQSLLDHVNNIKADRSEQDILYEVLLKLGLDLCAPIATRDFAGKRVNAVGDGVLFSCLAERINGEDVEDVAIGIADWRDGLDNTDNTTVVFRDSAFTDDVAKTNCTEILRQRGIRNVRSI